MGRDLGCNRARSGPRRSEARLLASDGASKDWFGYSVAVSGDVAVVGAVFDDDNGWNSGSAYVFRYDPDSSGWVQEEKLLAPDWPGNDHFGTSVAVSGDVALVGADYDHDNSPFAGSAYVFRYDPDTSEWIPESKLMASDGAAVDRFGFR